MGFGFLLIGYMTMMIDYGIKTIAQYNIGFDVFPDIIGYIFFFIAMKKLKPYAEGFKYAKIVTYFLMVLGGVTLAAQIFSFTNSHGEIIAEVLYHCEFARLVLFALFNIFAFSGIRKLSNDVELPKIARRAVAALIINLLYFIMKISIYAFSFTEAQRAFIIIIYSLTWYILLFFSLFLVMGCYMYICYEGEEEIIVPENKLATFLKNLKKK